MKSRLTLQEHDDDDEMNICEFIVVLIKQNGFIPS